MTKKPTPPWEEMLPRAEATAFVRNAGYPIGDSTLAHAAGRNSGPPFVRFGNKCFYEKGPLLAWAQSRLIIVGADSPFAVRNEEDAAIAA